MIGKLRDIFGGVSRDQGIATDPVCKMAVEMATPNGGTAEYQEITYYFCAPGCRKQFQHDAERFLE